MNIEESIGRQGHAMVLVRVLQLMCSGDKPQVLTIKSTSVAVWFGPNPKP